MHALLLLLLASPSPLQIEDLRCEAVQNPMNVDVPRPRLSWVVTSSDEGQRQSAYRILVASSADLLAANKGNLWDSGKVKSNVTLEIPYSGHDLRSSFQVFWKVQVWDARNDPSKWSSENRWTMGLLSPNDWHATWIGAGEQESQPITMLLRKAFLAAKPVKRAIVFASGLGQYEMWLNGHRIGSDWLTPGWTQYAKTVLCDAYDVTSFIVKGRNAVAMHIGNGMYDMSGDKRGGQQPNSLGKKKAIFQLELEFKDGTSQRVASDATWKWNPSPETYSGVFGGEDWDARKVLPGWKSSEFDDRDWRPVKVMASPTGVLRGLTHANPPLKVVEVRSPVKQTRPSPNVLVIDLGQNAPYIPQITAHGGIGTTLKLSPAELLKPDGTIDQRTMREGKYASYTLSGAGIETWNPSFWYCGSRYWQIEATDSQGDAIDPTALLVRFRGLMVHAAIKPAGSFASSNQLLNQIHNLIWWAMASNFASVISDCPHREKSGWLEQDHLMGDSLMYAFDMRAMFRKVIQDMHDTQLPNGMVPTMAPEYFIYQAGFRDSVEWGGAYLLLSDLFQEWYGNSSLTAPLFASMKRYVDYLATKAQDGILSNGLGDWNGGGADPRTPVAITDTAYYYALVSTLARFNAQSGAKSEASKYRAKAESIKLKFQDKFVDPATGNVGSGSQSAIATALEFDLIPSALTKSAFDLLLKDVQDHDYAVSCGEVGHPALLRALTRFGRADIVARIHLQTEKPGYGYQLKKGLTTLAESWDAAPISYNHFMLGHLMEWLYGDLVGIRPDPLGTAFSRIIVHPTPVPDVTWAKASYNSVRGRIQTAWSTKGDRFHLEVLIPANTTATVYMPSKSEGTIRITNPASRSFTMMVGQRKQDGYEIVLLPSGRFVLDSLLR